MTAHGRAAVITVTLTGLEAIIAVACGAPLAGVIVVFLAAAAAALFWPAPGSGLEDLIEATREPRPEPRIPDEWIQEFLP